MDGTINSGCKQAHFIWFQFNSNMEKHCYKWNFDWNNANEFSIFFIFSRVFWFYAWKLMRFCNIESIERQMCHWCRCFLLFSCSIWIFVSKCEKSKGVLPSKPSETRIWHKYFKEILGMNQFYRHRVYLLKLHLVPSVNPTKVSKQITTFTLSHNINSWIISAHWVGTNHLRPLKIVSQLLMLPISSKYSHYNRIVEPFHSWIWQIKWKAERKIFFLKNMEC